MKNTIKIIMFITIAAIIYMRLSYLFIPKLNIKKYGMYNTSMYELLAEKQNTIDTIVLGDSLVYSAISPMEIYSKHGYTVFDCAEPAQIMSDAYEYYKIAIDSQNPKIVIIEPNMFFRDPKEKPWFNKTLKILKNVFPLVKYHNNWKNLFFGKNWGHINKGYIKILHTKSGFEYDYMAEELNDNPYVKGKYKAIIPSKNNIYIKKIIEDCKKRNIKVLLLGVPSQRCWNYEKHKVIMKLSKQYGVEYINLNLDDRIDIDWKKETKDRGNHLNYLGAKKVSEFLGNYLNSTNIVESHKHKKGYEGWDQVLKTYMKS